MDENNNYIDKKECARDGRAEHFTCRYEEILFEVTCLDCGAELRRKLWAWRNGAEE